MYRLLVVEDQTDFYQDYLLRVFAALLPMEAISITHAPTLAAAVEALVEPWDMILMDYSMGPGINLDGHRIRDGADLVSLRRANEEAGGLPEAFILGISSNLVGNRLMQERGASGALSKLQVTEMAQLILGALKIREALKK